MNIWNILGIEPTTDIKTIKRAYASKTKIIHPEEKPDDFQVLYEAYQSALGQAKKGIVFHSSAAENRAEEAHIIASKVKISETAEEVPQENELLSYFVKSRKQEEERLAAAKEYWEDAWKKYRRPEEREQLKSYLDSREFRDIQWHPQVVHLLVEEFQKPVYYKYDEIWLYLWELYGFREKEEEVYQGDMKKLRDILYASYVRRQQELREKELYERNRQEEIRRQEIWRKIRRAALIMLCVAAPFLIYYCFTFEQRYIAGYMAEKYPNTEFSKPERGKKNEEGKMCYHFTSSTHPDFQITAFIGYQGFSEGRYVIEDYGSQLLEYYAEQYDLKSGFVEGSHTWFMNGDCPGVLYYSDDNLQELEHFCTAVIQMFEEQEELRRLDFVGICMEGVLYPKVMLTGGTWCFSVPGSQVYRPWEMTPEELVQNIRKAYIEYMFNYEPWKLTGRQYRDLGPEYEKICEESPNGGKYWYTLYDSGEWLCDLCVRTYEDGYDYHYVGDLRVSDNDTMISIGNAYHYLIAQGTVPDVLEDGTGFKIEYEGETGYFGEDPYLDFDELDKWYSEPGPEEPDWDDVRVITGPEVEIEE